MMVKLFEEDEYLLEWLTKYLKYRGCEVYGFSEDYVYRQGLPDACLCSKEEACADALLVGITALTKQTVQHLVNQEAQGCMLPRAKKGIMSASVCSEAMQLLKEQGYSVIKKPFKLAEITGWLESCR